MGKTESNRLRMSSTWPSQAWRGAPSVISSSSWELESLKMKTRALETSFSVWSKRNITYKARRNAARGTVKICKLNLIVSTQWSITWKVWVWEPMGMRILAAWASKKLAVTALVLMPRRRLQIILNSGASSHPRKRKTFLPWGESLLRITITRVVKAAVSHGVVNNPLRLNHPSPSPLHRTKTNL
jgi:hypothetical protein